jgi:hypothetical protein
MVGMIETSGTDTQRDFTFKDKAGKDYATASTQRMEGNGSTGTFWTVHIIGENKVQMGFQPDSSHLHSVYTVSYHADKQPDFRGPSFSTAHEGWNHKWRERSSDLSEPVQHSLGIIEEQAKKLPAPLPVAGRGK